MADLKKEDVENAQFVVSIYDSDGSNQIDCFYLGDILRCLNLNPTLATIEKFGGQKNRCDKRITFEEFLPIYSQCKKEIKEQGCYEDFLECLKLYDKNEDGTMLAAELCHNLLALGEKLSEPELDLVAKDCLDAEDEDGFIKYAPFLKKVCLGFGNK